MPFGLANVPGNFQQLMSVVLGGLEQFAVAYLDGILVFSSSANLGLIINEQGVRPDMDKVEVIRAMPVLKTIWQVRGFIGAIGYYWRFIPAFPRIATPLIPLTKNMPGFEGLRVAKDILTP